jgi:hypothetical protein
MAGVLSALEVMEDKGTRGVKELGRIEKWGRV